MSFLRRLAPTEKRMWTPSWLERLVGRTGGVGSSWAGISVTEQRALQHLTVYSCVSLISDTLSQLPVGLFQGVDTARVPLEDPDFLINPTGAAIEWPEWMGMAGVSYLLRGNTYGLVTDRDRLEFPRQVQLMHPDECRVFFDRDSGGPRYWVPGRPEPQQRYPLGDVWHVKNFTLPGLMRSIVGLNPIQYAALTIGTGLGAEEFGANWFAESANPSGQLITDQDIDDLEAADMQGRWMATHGDRQRKPAVLGSGLKWEPIAIKANESQFLETIKAKREEIAGWFRVPPHMLGMVDKSTSWGSGIEEQGLVYVTYTLGAPIVRFEKALSSLFPRRQYVKFNVAGLLRGRLTERYRAYLMGRQGGWLNVDDILTKEDMEPLPDGLGQNYLQPLNFGSFPINPTKEPGEPVTEPVE